MLIVIWPLLIAVVGVLMYVLSSNPKLSKIGEIIFFCGFFWFVAMLTGKAFKI